MRSLLPHPLLTVALTLFWLLLVNRFSINSLLFGLFLGIVIPLITRPYWPGRPKLKKPFRVLEYILIVLWDIIVANVTVAYQVVFMSNAARQPNWVAIPLDLKTPEAITVLAGTITMTPGTVSSDLSSGGHHLLVHCLHAPDPDAVKAEIKSRYERRLKEIFE